MLYFTETGVYSQESKEGKRHTYSHAHKSAQNPILIDHSVRRTLPYAADVDSMFCRVMSFTCAALQSTRNSLLTANINKAMIQFTDL